MTPLKLKVFLVEDTPDYAETLSELLTLTGQIEIVGRADTEKSAVEWSFQHEAGFDVAVVDLLLREGSGFSVVAHLAKYQPGKIVVLSGFVTPVMAERCKALGAIAAFSKSHTDDCIRLLVGLAARKGSDAG